MMGETRKAFPVLRYGRQYLRPVSFLGLPFAVYGGGEITAWSRVLDDEEAVCIVNVHGTQSRGADVLVDAALNPPGTFMQVALNTAQDAERQACSAAPARATMASMTGPFASA